MRIFAYLHIACYDVIPRFVNTPPNNNSSGRLLWSPFAMCNWGHGTSRTHAVTHDRRIAEQADRLIEIRDNRLLLDIAG